MVALVTLSESSKGTLKHLLNNLNLGIAAADFGTHFVYLLANGSADASLTERQKANLGQLLNKLNLGTAKLGFGNLMKAFLGTKDQRETAAQALTARKRYALVEVLNNLNLGLAEIRFGDIVDQAVTAVIAGATPGVPLSLSTDLTPTKTAADGADVTFAVVAAGGTTPYSYQWYWKGSAGGFVLIDSAVNPSAVTATLVNHAVTTASAGTYKCEVADATGGTVTSAECVLTIN